MDFYFNFTTCIHWCTCQLINSCLWSHIYKALDGSFTLYWGVWFQDLQRKRGKIYHFQLLSSLFLYLIDFAKRKKKKKRLPTFGRKEKEREKNLLQRWSTSPEGEKGYVRKIHLVVVAKSRIWPLLSRLTLKVIEGSFKIIVKR